MRVLMDVTVVLVEGMGMVIAGMEVVVVGMGMADGVPVKKLDGS
jgi:hypothetical protein